jgi:squalene-associated FAD-dependent desaturase
MSGRRVAIIGGGLAGIAAAVRLVESGIEPVLIESRKRLGGRATSLVDPRSGVVIDNCQHVLLGCCTNLIDLYARLGVLDLIEWHKTVYWTRGRAGGGEICEVKAGWFPAPLHLSGSFWRMSIFSKADKRCIARAMWRMMRMGSKGRLVWRNRTFGEFLAECKQPQSLVESFWNTIVVSACNLDVSRVSAYYALQVFQEGFLANKWSYTMGLATVPLADLYAPAIDKIIDAGGDIQLGVSAKAIAFDGRRVTDVITDEGAIDCAGVISAIPFDRLDKLTSDALKRADRRLQKLDQFQVSPILGVHLYFDQPVMDLPHLVLVNPPNGVQWLFRKDVATRAAASSPRAPSPHANLHHIHAVISAAEKWMSMSEDEIIQRVMEDIRHALPRSIGLQPVEARAIKEKRATFAAVPGVDDIRPSTTPEYSGGVENLFLAADWVDTGWPATMEGAVRSGYAAATALTGTPGIVEDVPPAFISRLLGMR